MGDAKVSRVMMTQVNSSGLPGPTSADAWARLWFERLLANEIDSDEFEQVVMSLWSIGLLKMHAPRTAAWIKALVADAAGQDARYAHEAPHLGFRSQWLSGRSGQPAALHIDAPPEHRRPALPEHLNRPPHRHDSGRMGLITWGRAVFLIEHPQAPNTRLLQVPVQTGDLVIWPAWVDHTFDARQGFGLVSCMAQQVSPEADGFMFPAQHPPAVA